MEARFQRKRTALEQRGWGMWAIEDEAGVLIGSAGLQPVPVESGLPFAPTVEAGWYLSRAVWG